ncbi:hypothetical protein [Geomonas edaphica]|uniref:hypothetical protein n=1 Tax=Geomonas edaphica TaxID=2570226 RepID=UPI0018E0B43F|nr:hypothetical protein [Geomonas edaphica]
MKIYFYSPETGVYQGEDFVDATLVMRSPPQIPEWATTIAPPAYSKGEVPVFLADEERWVLTHLERIQNWHLVPAREDEPLARELPVTSLPSE